VPQDPITAKKVSVNWWWHTLDFLFKKDQGHSTVFKGRIVNFNL